MDFQEFPKLLYLGGSIEAAYVIVHNEAEEDAADGYEVANLSQAEGEAKVPAKRGRPRKAD